jgi:glutathione S-transferase
MLELFQITGSSSFAARCALEELGVEYETIDVLPRDRSVPAGFAALSPSGRVPLLRDGDVVVHEVGAVLLYLGDRFPRAGLAPPPGSPARGDLLRWLFWCSNTFHAVWHPLLAPRLLTVPGGETDGIRARGWIDVDACGVVLERALEGREWLVGDRYSVADVYLYMLVGWQHYLEGYEVGGPAVQAHYARVGARAPIARTRALDDLDERLLRHHPGQRAGRAVDTVELPSGIRHPRG